MLGSLDLDDELDDIEVLLAVEEAFDLKISDQEAESILNVGQMFDILRDKVQTDDAHRKCANAMAFYRVRRALNDLRPGIGRSPSCDLLPLHRVYTKSFVNDLEARSGLRLPPPQPSAISTVGSAFFLTAILSAAILSAYSPNGSFALVVGGLFACGALFRFDPGRLPDNCHTLGALAAKAASLSYGRLVKQGADGRDGRLWQALVEVLADFARVPADQIARETLFLASQIKSSPAAA